MLEARGIKHGHTVLFNPRRNGKAGRMNRTLAQKGRYARAWESEEHCNWDRPHSACGGIPPMSRIAGVNNVLARNI